MSDQDWDLQRLRRAFASLGQGHASTSACPAPERLWAAVHGELPPEDVRPLVSHLLECGACAEAWRLAREIGARPEVATVRSARRWWGGWGAVAAGLAAVALGASALLQGPHGTPGYREGRRDEIRSLVPESRPLARSRAVLRWTPGPDGATYAVQVATDRLEPVLRAQGLAVPEVLVPPDKVASLPAGTKLLWRVEAVAPDGSRLTSSTFVARLE
jgi:putative zinc finger protein